MPECKQSAGLPDVPGMPEEIMARYEQDVPFTSTHCKRNVPAQNSGKAKSNVSACTRSHVALERGSTVH
jgi:hypothetical protein